MTVDRRPPAHVCAGSTTINERSSTSTEGRTRTGDTGAYRGGPGDWVTRDIKKSWMSSELFGARFSCIITLLCSHLGLLISYLHVCMNVGVCGYVASRLNSARPPQRTIRSMPLVGYGSTCFHSTQPDPVSWQPTQFNPTHGRRCP